MRVVISTLIKNLKYTKFDLDSLKTAISLKLWLTKWDYFFSPDISTCICIRIFNSHSSIPFTTSFSIMLLLDECFKSCFDCQRQLDNLIFQQIVRCFLHSWMMHAICLMDLSCCAGTRTSFHHVLSRVLSSYTSLSHILISIFPLSNQSLPFPCILD